MVAVTRQLIQEYLDEYGDHPTVVAALLEDYPELAKIHKMHRRPIIDLLIEDFNSYKRQ